MKRIAASVYVSVVALGTTAFIAEARPIYTRKENKPCGYCHTRTSGGGERGFRGMYYGANGLSFDDFEEKREALIAGLIPNTEGKDSVPKVSYNGNVSGPAAQQIQVAALRGPVVLLFVEKADDDTKAAVKSIAEVAKAYGTQVTVLGVAKSETALALSDELGGLIRVYSDPELVVAKKFKASQALDVALVAKLGEPVKSFEGYSRANVDAVTKLLAAGEKIQTPVIDMAKQPEKTLRGAKL